MHIDACIALIEDTLNETFLHTQSAHQDGQENGARQDARKSHLRSELKDVFDSKDLEISSFLEHGFLSPSRSALFEQVLTYLGTKK